MVYAGFASVNQSNAKGGQGTGCVQQVVSMRQSHRLNDGLLVLINAPSLGVTPETDFPCVWCLDIEHSCDWDVGRMPSAVFTLQEMFSECKSEADC